MRLFIGIDFEKDIKEKFVFFQKELFEKGIKAKWEDLNKFHITLNFLGDINQDLLEKIFEVSEKSVKEIEPFLIGFTKLGVFPSLERPKIIWIGCSDKDEILSGLSDKINQGLEFLGLKEEKRFIPHVTLGKFRQRLSEKEKELLREITKPYKIYSINSGLQKMKLSLPAQAGRTQITKDFTKNSFANWSNLGIDQEKILVSKISVFESVLYKQGSKYQILKEFSFT